MAVISDSFWYDSSNDEYVIPVVRLGDLTDKPNAADPMGLCSGWSSAFAFKGQQIGEFPVILNPGATIPRSLGRIGTFYPSSATISSDHYFRLTYRPGQTNKFTYYANASGVYDVASLDETLDGSTDFFLATAVINEVEYLGIYAYGTGLGSDQHASWMFAYCPNASGAWNELFTYLAIDPAPGYEGFKPTGTRYGDRKGIGGRGKHGSHQGKTPGYYTDTLTNPGAPDESGASAIHSGMLTVYDVSDNALAGLASCLFGQQLSTQITGLFYNPMDFIISLNIFPCQPVFGSSVPIKLGRWQCTAADLGADASGLPLTSQFKTLDFGSIDVPENWGSFLDYSNTQIELYLPFIGSVEVDVAEVMDGSISLEYTIDFLTGMCVANVNCNKLVETPDGEVYPQSSQHSYQGNCAISVPLGQVQYGNMIGSLINASAVGLSKGPGAGAIALAGEAVSGGMKPSVSTKGTISANAGFCAVLRPYIRITRPISAESESFQEVMGYTSYVDSKLGDCTGFCVCDNIDLSSISGATESELERIKQICLEGVHV